jgi:hypothetical protein
MRMTSEKGLNDSKDYARCTVFEEAEEELKRGHRG